MLLYKLPSYKKTNDFVMPQPAHGKPVNSLKGQKDCSVSRFFPELKNIKKNGIVSVKKAPTIP